jgi:hypothetical protein
MTGLRGEDSTFTTQTAKADEPELTPRRAHASVAFDRLCWIRCGQAPIEAPDAGVIGELRWIEAQDDGTGVVLLRCPRRVFRGIGKATSRGELGDNCGADDHSRGPGAPNLSRGRTILLPLKDGEAGGREHGMIFGAETDGMMRTSRLHLFFGGGTSMMRCGAQAESSS